MTAPRTTALPNWLDAASRSHPGRLALSFGVDRWTFAELRRSVASAAVVLDRAHANSHGRIGILAANRPGFIFAVHAATRLAVPFVPLNWRQTSDELAWQLQDAGISVLVVDKERLAVAETACAGLPIAIVPIQQLERASESGDDLRNALRIDLEREAAVIYTSGTTGRPKGARLTYGNLWFSAVGSALHLGHRAEDIWLLSMPLFHVGGLSILFRGVIGATPIVLYERFDPERVLAAIDDGATLLSVVPAMLQRMLDVRGDAPWPPSLRCMLVGGSAAPPGLIEEGHRLGIPVAPTYGLTEAASQVTTLPPALAPVKPSSSGLPLPLTEVRVVARTGHSAPAEIGDIEIRGLTVFAGYLGEGDGTSGRTADGWFRTGDTGSLDDDGYLYVLDRRVDLINSGGENVYPAEIERVLREHPSVIDAGVVGVADDAWGSRPVAAVVWRGDPATANAELHRHCAERLSRYKIPDRILLLAELPRSPSGKLLRRELLEMIAESRARPSTAS